MVAKKPPRTKMMPMLSRLHAVRQTVAVQGNGGLARAAFTSCAVGRILPVLPMQLAVLASSYAKPNPSLTGPQGCMAHGLLGVALSHRTGCAMC